MHDKKPIEKAPQEEIDLKNRLEEANKLNKDNKEHGGQEGPDPTRYGDWGKGGRCTDF